MGNTIWIKVRDERGTSCNQNDHSILYQLSADLDTVAARLGVARLSDYFDHTAVMDSFAHELEDSIDDTQLGWPSPAELDNPPRWFDARGGLATITAIQQHLNAHPELFRFEGIPSKRHWRAVLLEELEDCRAELARAAAHGKTFQLSVMM